MIFIHFAGEKSSTRLQEASIKVIEQSKCVQQYSSQRTALINEKIICAGEPGKDTCQVRRIIRYFKYKFN